jgi:hypothetical protein
MHKLILALAFTGAALSVNAQDSAPATTDVLKATILSPGVSYEKSIGKKHTLYGQVYASPTIQYFYSSSLGSEFDFYLDPAALVQYRYYYNLEKRAGKDKFTRLNSGNYFGATVQTYLSKVRLDSDQLEESKRRPVTTIGAIWGMQRNYAKRFSLDINLGAGYRFASVLTEDINNNFVRRNEGRFTLIADIGIGIWLNKRS